MTARLLLLFIVGMSVGACYPEVDIEPVPSDYKDWYRIDTYGPAPGHGDTYRIIYANQAATERVVASDNDDLYPPGSIIVKEIYGRTDDDQPDNLKYIAVMRKIGAAPDGAELFYSSPGQNEYGWLFTYANASLTSEEFRSSCWDSCHVAAPLDATFIDYSLGYEEP